MYVMVAQEESLIGDVYAQIEQLWGPLSEQHRELLLANLRIRQYRKNEIIYKDLETPKQMYYLIQGKVKIYKDGIATRSYASSNQVSFSVTVLFLRKRITKQPALPLNRPSSP